MNGFLKIKRSIETFPTFPELSIKVKLISEKSFFVGEYYLYNVMRVMKRKSFEIIPADIPNIPRELKLNRLDRETREPRG